jgi:hypothetical protein
MFVLVRSLTGQNGAALIAGFVFAFLPYRFMHYGHLELQMAQWMPLSLWAFHRAIERGRLRDGLLTGLFFAAQALSCLYYSIFFLTFLVPLAVALLVAAGRERRGRCGRPLLAGAALAGVLIAPLVPAYLAARQSVGERPLREIAYYSATPQNYLAAHSTNTAFGKITAGVGQQERELFQGFAVPAIAVMSLWPPLSAARIGYGLATAVAFDVSLGFNGVSYPWLHTFIVPYKGLRVPARMAMLVGLGLSVLVGFGIARLTVRRTQWMASGIALVLGCLIFFEYRPTLEPFGPFWTAPPPVYDRIEGGPSTVLLELPLKSPDIYLEPIYMYFSTFHWHTLVNGYSGFSPPSYSSLLAVMATFPDEQSIAELRRRNVAYVVAHGALFERTGDYDELTTAMSRSSALELVGVYPWEGKDTSLYRLVPGKNTQP